MFHAKPKNVQASRGVHTGTDPVVIKSFRKVQRYNFFVKQARLRGFSFFHKACEGKADFYRCKEMTITNGWIISVQSFSPWMPLSDCLLIA